jgi:phosphoribosylamine--glycine ligase
MRILVLGAGGREHSLCAALYRSPKLTALYAIPGNPGIAEFATCIAKEVDNHPVIGPEAPLVTGLVDTLKEAGIACFGPSKEAAILEASKAFTKQLCIDHNIPTARYLHTHQGDEAKAFAKSMALPIVVKADGLAAGKGVVIAASYDEAAAAIDEMLSGSLGEAGSSIVIEEFLQGSELSFFALCDGSRAIAFGSAVDHKRVGEGDTGLNTGGMGTLSPAPQMTKKLESEIMDRIILPTMRAMGERGTPFSGILFAGIMLTEAGPQLLEYNVRFGDPETQSLLMRLESDLPTLLLAAANGNLQDQQVHSSDDHAVCIVMASAGYPGAYKKGTVIKGTKAATDLGCMVIHAGTTQSESGALLAMGGRVLGICAKAPQLTMALNKAYQGVTAIDWPEGYYRRDIGKKFL